MERILNSIGIGLLALCFVIAIARITSVRMAKTEDGSELIHVSLAHWQLESGVRQALDVMAEEYMKIHPEVKISQIAIPERIYTNWLITQLVGGTAPDLIQIGKGTTDERLARFFVPLTDVAELPNPYNNGTPLEDLPLRETFFDGMLGGYNDRLLEFYGVPLSAFTIRLYVNLDLVGKITGSKDLPTNYSALLELCKKIQAHGAETGIPIIPIAGSKYNSPLLMNNLFSSQTQLKLREINPPGHLHSMPVRNAEAFIEGKWDFNSPEIRSGMSVMRDLAGFMQPGFMQVMRDDATFYFVQGRAAMITTGSWDSSSIAQQVSFPYEAIKIPLPSKEDPNYGRFVLGSVTERGTNTGLALGLTRNSKHPEVAIDFLRFMSSQSANQKFSDVSKWIPSVVGVIPTDQTKQFMMDLGGYTPGFPMIEDNRPDASRGINNAMHLLFSQNGGVDEFISAFEDQYLEGLIKDLNRETLNSEQALQRMDTQLGAFARLADKEAKENGKQRKRYEEVVTALSSNDRNFSILQMVSEKARRKVQEEKN